MSPSPNHAARTGAAPALSALAFFLVMASYYGIRPIRDQFSGAVGSVSLPLFYGATFVVMLVLTPVFGALVARVSRRRLILWGYSFFIACLCAFAPAFLVQEQLGARLLGTVFYVWVSVFNLFVVSLFWSLMADLFSSEESHRYFPMIALGGTLGALAGPTLASLLVVVFGLAPLLLVSAGLLMGAMAVLMWLSVSAGAGREAAPAIGGSLLAGARQVFTVPFLRYMALLMLLSDGVGTVAYALLADYVKENFHDAASRTAFYGHVDLAANLLVITLQLGPTRWLLTRYGPVPCLVTASAVNVLLLGSLALLGGGEVRLPWLDGTFDPVLMAVPLLALVLACSRGFGYGMTVPAANAMYTRVSREAKYKGKNFIDTVVWRFGDVVITSALSALRSLGMGVPLFAGVSAVCAALAGWVGVRAGRTCGSSADALAASETGA
ncbi:NTP/NDP exchange transporter [Dyella sp.]|uniref:NTP/NDP exchange transporter n=1 Tax=Dyella sp. TaxID=1869338 RepID=UPI002D79672B|nr:MFS transporter [Dyella sp.]HET6430789.1 MFS transporter [Dyella sp.]